MRLTSFSLEKYGNFADVRLTLDPEPGHLNFVVGPNGGGKTVLRQGFRDLLFGIPGQTKMAFLHGYPGMRLFAEGIDAGGAPFAFGRRKGIGNTLMDAAGNSLDPNVLGPLIGELDEALFERLFGLDSHLLRAGAEAILASGGDLAEALFAAGSGIASVRRLRNKFEEARDQLAPGRQTRSRPLYQALDDLVGAYRELRAATVQPRDWQDLKAKLDLTRDRRASLARDHAQIRSEIERLQRIKRVSPWLHQWQEARELCAVVVGAPRLAADTEERWRKARQMVEIAERELRASTDALQGIAERLSGEKPDGLLEQGPSIEDLDRAQNQIVSDQRDLPPREAERREAATRIENALSALGVKAFDEIREIMPAGPQIAAARNLVRRHEILVERLEKAATEAGRHERAIRAAEAELDGIGEPPDTGDLAVLVAETRAEGDPRRRLSSLQTKLGQEETRLAAAFAKVPLWKRGLEPLVAIISPTREMIDRAAGALTSATAGHSDAELELDRLCRERVEATERRDTARQGKPVPDATAVAAARAHRDRGWSLIRRSKFEGESLEAEIEAYGKPADLVVTFERALGDADGLADRRDEESRRLATIATLEGTISRLEGQIEVAERRLAEARRSHGEALQAWAALAGPLGFENIPDPADLRDVLAARAIVVDLRAARDVAQQAVAAEAAQQEAIRLRFAQLIPQDQRGSLSEALATAQQVIDRGAALHERRNQVQAELQTLRRLHRQAVDDRNTAQAAFANWQEAWRECLANLNRPAEETPAAVERAIELIEEAHRERQRLAELDHRIRGMRANIAGFLSRVDAVVSAVAPDLSGQPAESAARELRRRLDANRKIEARRDQLRDQLKQARAKRADTAAKHQQTEAARESLRKEIGGGSDQEIASRIEQAAERARAEARLQECDRKLAEIGDGWPIPVLEREIGAVTPETVDLELAGLQLDAERVTTDREQAAVDEQRLSDELRRIETGENAIEAEECRQAAIASVTRISAEALLYHAASCLLQAGLERLRDAGDGGLLRRVGTVFARITGGAYAGVDADQDEKGVPFLIAIEAGGTTTKRVDQLSEGTRDQLFLALRLVMLEDYAKKAPAPPLIADDLLQTFDDYGRTTNALTALADLSRHVQVIVLSHHRQLIDVARGLPKGIANICELAA